MFKVSDNVVLIGEGTQDDLLEIVDYMYAPNTYRVKILSTGQFGPVFKNDIRLATEEEIALGHRVQSRNDQAINHYFVSGFKENETLGHLSIKQNSQVEVLDMVDVSPNCEVRNG